MFAKTTVLLGILGVNLAIPLFAQVDEDPLQGLNIKVGGGYSVATGPAGRYFGTNGNFLTGVGANLRRHHSVELDFMWSGLSPIKSGGNWNLYSLTENYRFRVDRIARSPLGLYLVAGGGWYYRRVSVNGPEDFSIIPARGTGAGGINGGIGLNIRIFPDSAWSFFMESRYHYAWTATVPTSLIPVSFGFRFN